jgi:hypothetical protein
MRSLATTWKGSMKGDVKRKSPPDLAVIPIF